MGSSHLEDRVRQNNDYPHKKPLLEGNQEFASMSLIFLLIWHRWQCCLVCDVYQTVYLVFVHKFCCILYLSTRFKNGLPPSYLLKNIYFPFNDAQTYSDLPHDFWKKSHPHSYFILKRDRKKVLGSRTYVEQKGQWPIWKSPWDSLDLWKHWHFHPSEPTKRIGKIDSGSLSHFSAHHSTTGT